MKRLDLFFLSLTFASQFIAKHGYKFSHLWCMYNTLGLCFRRCFGNSFSSFLVWDEFQREGAKHKAHGPKTETQKVWFSQTEWLCKVKKQFKLNRKSIRFSDLVTVHRKENVWKWFLDHNKLKHYCWRALKSSRVRKCRCDIWINYGSSTNPKSWAGYRWQWANPFNSVLCSSVFTSSLDSRNYWQS